MVLDEKTKAAVLGALNASLELLQIATHPKVAWADVARNIAQIREVRDMVSKAQAGETSNGGTDNQSS